MTRNIGEDDVKIMEYASLGRSSYKSVFKNLSITNWIIVLNFIIFFLVFILAQIFGSDKVVSYVAIDANSFFSGKFYILLISMFVHFEIWHLLGNMISLFFIGNFVERLIGRKRFIYVYIISGLFAGLFFVTLSYYLGNICILDVNGCIGERLFFKPDTPAVGASGAIFALLGILAILTPYTRVYLIIGPIIAMVLQAIFHSIYPESPFISIIDLIVFVYTMVAIFSIFSFNSRAVKIALPLSTPFYLLPVIAIVPLMVISLFIELPFGNTAHLGGLIAGYIYASYLRKKYRKKTDMIRKIFSR
ncbi:MAG: rhomboid family intramembrane serine protease [Nanoarchaeota archaeon]|nr:rhomboid family intramembrane serine protease [Nanoarchaeota archaeon]